MSLISSIKDKFKNVWIPEWKSAWKMLSVQASAIFSTASLTWLALPDEQKGTILGIIGVNGPAMLASVGFILVVVARLKAQPDLPK